MIRKIKNFIQRGLRGFSDEDLWSFDVYLAEVIVKGLKEFKKGKQNGLPIDLYELYNQDEDKALQEWVRIIDKMILSFEIHIDLLDNPRILKGEEKYRYEEGLELFIKYLGDLWS